MTPEEIAALGSLLAQLIPLAVGAYQGIKANTGNTLPPLADLLAQADANWQSVIDNAKGQLNPPPAS